MQLKIKTIVESIKQNRKEEVKLNTNKQMLTVKELAVYFCVSESTIRKMVRESRIPFIKIFSKILFNKV